MAEGLSIISKFSGQLKDVSLVEAKGLIDGTTNAHFKQELTSLLEKNIKMIVLDLQAVEYINSAGLGSIMEVRNKLDQAGGLMVIVGAGGKVKKVMDMVGFPSILPMTDSLAEAKRILEEFMTRQSEESGGGAATRFPLMINCTSCQNSFEVMKPGPSKCSTCGELIHVEDTGRVFSLTPHDQARQRGVSGTLELASDIRLLRLMRQFSSGFCKEHGFKDQELEDIELAVDEASTNIVEHAYNRDPNCLLKMQVEAFDDRVVILLVDNGKAFDSSKIPIPDPQKRVEKGHVSGLGRYFMHTTMDEVNYVSIPGVSNTLKMVKYKAGCKPVEEVIEDRGASIRAGQIMEEDGQAGRGSVTPSEEASPEVQEPPLQESSAGGDGQDGPDVPAVGPEVPQAEDATPGTEPPPEGGDQGVEVPLSMEPQAVAENPVPLPIDPPGPEPAPGT